MASAKSLDWKGIAERRGVELSESAAEKLNALDQQMRLMSAMVDWKEEPVTAFRLEEEEPAR